MVVGITTTCLNPAYGDVYSIQHYVIKLVSDLQQVGDLGSSTNKTDYNDIAEILLKVALNTITITHTKFCNKLKYKKQTILQKDIIIIHYYSLLQTLTPVTTKLGFKGHSIYILIVIAFVIRYNVVLSVRYNKTTQEGKYHTNTVILYKRAYTSIFTVCLYWFYIVGPDYLCHNYYYCLIVVYLLYFTDTEKLCKYNDMMFLLTKDEKNGINIKASRMMGNII